MKRLTLALCMLAGTAHAAPFAYVVNGIERGPPYTPQPGRTLAMDWPGDMVPNFVDLAGLTTLPADGWTYTNGTFNPPVFTPPAVPAPTVSDVSVSGTSIIKTMSDGSKVTVSLPAVCASGSLNADCTLKTDGTTLPVGTDGTVSAFGGGIKMFRRTASTGAAFAPGVISIGQGQQTMQIADATGAQPQLNGFCVASVAAGSALPAGVTLGRCDITGVGQVTIQFTSTVAISAGTTAVLNVSFWK